MAGQVRRRRGWLTCPARIVNKNTARRRQIPPETMKETGRCYWFGKCGFWHIFAPYELVLVFAVIIQQFLKSSAVIIQQFLKSSRI
jgi:hypothetical protein